MPNFMTNILNKHITKILCQNHFKKIKQLTCHTCEHRKYTVCGVESFDFDVMFTIRAAA